MSISNTWHETLVRSTAAGSNFGSFTTAKTVIPADCVYTLPANYFEVGSTMRVRAIGSIGTLVTTPGTITFQVMFGSVIAFTTGALQLNATAHTTIPFWLDIALTCRSIGASTTATMMGQAMAFGTMFTVTAGQTDGVNTMAYLMAPNTAPAVGTGFSSVGTIAIDFFAGFSINNAANTVQIQQYSVISER